MHVRGLHRPTPSNGAGARRSLDRLVNEAAEQITRFSPPQAFSASAADGLIIDIRSDDSRELHGVVPGSLHVPRTVLEWRVAVDSPWRNVYLGGLDERLILICDHGYSSILAASYPSLPADIESLRSASCRAQVLRSRPPREKQ